jgi:hypothetical protein
MVRETEECCSVEGCLRPSLKRTLCSSHYQRWQKYGDPHGGGAFRNRRRDIRQICAVETCSEEAHARGWCSAHYSRWRKYGDPLGVGSVPHNHLPDVCRIAGCSRKPHARELCITHYRRWRLYGDPLKCAPAKPKVAKPVVKCSVDDCEAPAEARSKYGLRLCVLHRRSRDIVAAEERRAIRVALRQEKGSVSQRSRRAPKVKHGGANRGKPECSIEQCTRPACGSGMCPMHHDRWKRHGDPLVSKRSVEPALRFIKDVALPFMGEECLIWPFTRSDEGRPNIRLNRRRVSAARYICILAHGEPEDSKLESAHRCGNGHLGCVNPQHLRWATRKENVADAIEHGVFPLGKRMSIARMREDVVRQIMVAKKTASAREVASRFGVPARSVRDVWSGRKWSWLFSGARKAA